MSTSVKSVKLKWILLLSLFLFQAGANVYSQELPKNKKDWMSFESYRFSGNSSGYTYEGNIYFKRNGVEVDIKNDKVVFLKDGYFKTNTSIVKLEQGKLVVSTSEELSGLKYSAEKMEKKEDKLFLMGNVLVTFPNKSTFKANEITMERKDGN